MQSRLLLNRAQPVPRNNSAYAPDAVVQWWYFDAQLANGWRLLTFFLPKALGTTDGHAPDQPQVEIVLRSPQGETILERRFFKPEQFSASTTTLDAAFGDDCSLAYDPDKGRYLLKARAGRLAYDLEILPELPPWSPLSKTGRSNRPIFMLARRDLFTKDYFHYAPFVPRGKLSGKIIVDGQAMDADGSAYHEQGRMNFPLNKMVPVWYWLHIEKAPWTIISGTAHPPEGLPGNRPWGGYGYIANKNTPLMSGLDMSGLFVLWTRIHHDFPQKPGDQGLAWDVTARFFRPGLLVRVSLSSLYVLDYLPFEHGEKTPQQPYWAQTVARTEVDIVHGLKKARFSCEGILETMVTGGGDP